MKRRGIGRALVWSMPILAIAAGATVLWVRGASHAATRTSDYLATLDLEAIARRGSDSMSPRYDPERIGKPLERIDVQHDYDFDRLEAVERALVGVDRRRVLEAIFARVTEGATTGHETHVAVLRFLQRASVHNGAMRPIYRDGTLVFDPLVILELNEMHCGQVSRLAVDLFEAGGFEARTVSLGGHTIAEVFYDGAWHYFDADATSGNGLTALTADGVIPSVRELSTMPEAVDALPHRFELRFNGRPRVGGTRARSYNYFFSEACETHPTEYVFKRGDAYLGDRTYGWRRPEHAPKDWITERREARHQPGAVRWRSVRVRNRGRKPTSRLKWHPAADEDADVLGYRLYVGSQPRGWNYGTFVGNEGTEVYWSHDGGWTPDMYEAAYRLPPHDVALIETTDLTVRIPLSRERAHYVTIMAFDAYHEDAGKTLYLMSNELEIAID